MLVIAPSLSFKQMNAKQIICIKQAVNVISFVGTCLLKKVLDILRFWPDGDARGEGRRSQKRIYCLGTVNICKAFHGEKLKSKCDISVSV